MFTPKSLSTTGLVKSVNDRWQTFTVGLVMNSVCIWCKDNAYKEWYSGLVVYASSRISCARVVAPEGALCQKKKNVPIFLLSLAVTFRGDQQKIAVLLAETRDEARK